MTFRTSMLIFMAASVLLHGCEAKTRYEALSFFFDGVPSPEDGPARAKGRAGPAKKPGGDDAQERHSIHGPYAAKMCQACHQRGTNALLLPKEDLCRNCHFFQTVRRQHGPLASGGCTVCHDPHQSSHQYLLVSKAKEFCTYCHDAKKIYSRDVHRGSDAACTECHNPHGSDNEFLLR